MIRKSFVIAMCTVLFTFSGGIVSAQLLSLDDSTSTTTVTIDGVTHTISIPSVTFATALERVKSLVFYLRQDSRETAAILEVQATVASTTPSVSDVSNDILDIVFQTSDTVLYSSNESTNCPVFVGSFKKDDEGSEILKIQRFLNKDTSTQIATSGAGSLGNETNYFGTLTFNAVRAFQQKYASEILNPVGLFQATGYWGASTRAKANQLSVCST